MRSLTLKLSLGFLLISLIGVALVAVFIRWATIREFDRFVLDQAQSNFIDDVSAYYQANGSWKGVAQSLPRQTTQPPPGTRGQPPPPQSADSDQPELQPPLPQQPPFSFALVDQNRIVVIPAGPFHFRERLRPARLEQGVEVEVEGQVVGTVLTTGEPPALTPREEQFLASINQALLYAAFGATIIGLLLGVFLARTLTNPLRELTAATRAMAKGELEQQVAVRSQDELGELAASFNQMSADLTRANELRRQMTADIAHDLRTPLSVIKGYTEGLRDGILQPTTETFQTIHQEAEQLSRLVAAHLPRAQQLEIGLQVTAEANVPAVNVDPERMAQVLGNLVSNALRHTPAGGQISLAAAQRGNNVLLTVQDNGVGIAPDKLRRIFTRFYRGDEARQAHEGESGLGLAIAKSLVELHGGAISLESILGEGTTFAIALPVGS